jgi:hypothetical protein
LCIGLPPRDLGCGYRFDHMGWLLFISYVPSTGTISSPDLRLQLTAEMMRTDAGFHADQARQHVCNGASNSPRDTSDAAGSRRADQSPPRRMSSYQYRCRPRRSRLNSCRFAGMPLVSAQTCANTNRVERCDGLRLCRRNGAPSPRGNSRRGLLRPNWLKDRSRGS